MTVSLHTFPGWGADCRVFAPFLAALGQPATPHDTSDPTDQPQLPPNSTLIGWSLGAQRALKLAVAQPDCVTSLVLFAPTPCFVTKDDWPHGTPATQLCTFADGVARNKRTTLKRFIALQCVGDAQARVVAAQITNAVEENIATLQKGLTWLADTDLRAILRQITQPVLIIHGEQDRVTPIDAGQYLADHLTTAQWHPLPHTGHAPFLSQPERCAQIVRHFLSEIS